MGGAAAAFVARTFRRERSWRSGGRWSLEALWRSAQAHERIPVLLSRVAPEAVSREDPGARRRPRARGEHPTDTGASEKRTKTLKGSETPREAGSVR
jgi:hypothetical protein